MNQHKLAVFDFQVIINLMMMCFFEDNLSRHMFLIDSLTL